MLDHNPLVFLYIYIYIASKNRTTLVACIFYLFNKYFHNLFELLGYTETEASCYLQFVCCLVLVCKILGDAFYL